MNDQSVVDATRRAESAATTVLTFSNSRDVATQAVDRVRTFELPVPDDTVSITGKLIGYASSHRDRHNPHTGDFAARGEKCSACRWFECRIFRVDPRHSRGNNYAVHTQGPSLVPGEFVKCRIAFAQTGYEVIELLTVRQSNSVFLPAASSRAIAQAAGLDRDIETAYINRAVA